MFKRKVEDSGKNTLFQFAFRIFFVHIVNIIVMLVVGMLVQNLDSLGLSVSAGATSLIVTIVCMALYLVMTYLEGWRRGERDYNLVLYKHMEYQKFRGLFAGLISQIPAVICAIVMIFPSASFKFTSFVRYFYMNFNYLFVTLDSLNAGGNLSAFVYYLCHFLPAILAPVLVGVAYQLGYKRFRVLDKVMWVKPDDKKRRNLR